MDMRNPEVMDRSMSAWALHMGREVPPVEVRAALVRGTIAEAAAATARRLPDKSAIQVGADGMTHAELDDTARRVASWLTDHDAAPGTTVLLAGGNTMDYVVGYLAVLHSGAAVAPVNPMLTSRELDILLQDTRPVVTLASGDRLEQLRELDVPGTLLSLEGDGPGTLARAAARSRAAPVLVHDPDVVAHLAFTSGTTGRPKATPLTHGNLLASVRAVMWAWRWTEDDVLVHALPMQHGHGLSAVQAVLLSGCRSVVLPAFDPEALCRTIAEERATVLFGVPAMYERILTWGGLADADLTSLRLATTGSAALSPRTSDAMAAVLGHRPLERYGCTETGYVLSNPYDGDRRAGEVGIPLPGAEVAVVDVDAGPVADGAEGEIVARGPQVFAGYLHAAATEAFVGDGWFRTGDVGRVDPVSGYLTITGRAKDLIITGGLNVYPREVELALEALPHVASAAVVGVPSERWGEEVTAFIVPADGCAPGTDDLRAAAAELLAAYKRPKAFHLVEALPRNHMGKVLREVLVERAMGILDEGT